VAADGTGTDRVTLEDFHPRDILERGGFGEVFLMRKKGGPDDGRLYAMKRIEKAGKIDALRSREDLKTEREVLEAVRGFPFLVGLHYAFENDVAIYFVMDYMSGGDFLTHYCCREHFTKDEVRFYIGEVILALEQLHKMGIMYRGRSLQGLYVLRHQSLCSPFSYLCTYLALPSQL
jgi:ribosomal protein S6 kinase alpha-5